MININLNLRYSAPFTKGRAFTSMLTSAKRANALLLKKKGVGAELTGWMDYPTVYDRAEISRIKAVAANIRTNSELVIVIAIGGSYLGAKAVIEALSPALGYINKSPRKDPIIVYAGYNLSGSYAVEIKELIKQYETSVVVISKSGTTLEPVISFRFIREEMQQKYGRKESASRIIAITDANEGALMKLSTKLKYDTFSIPDNIGGRYSVLTTVGLLPIAIAGFDIQLLLDGAAEMEKISKESGCIVEQYAAARNILSANQKDIEILASFEPKLASFSKWWTQLFAESEGKELKGIYPTSVIYSSDLHSIGQYIQDGKRNIFETFINISTARSDMKINMNVENFDNLNYIAGMKYSEINSIAQQATVIAHSSGGVPCIELEIQRLDEINIGGLIYFFERACAISGYMQGINPFDQPGVDEYKKNMTLLMDKQ